jgi:hypothetical protein
VSTLAGPTLSRPVSQQREFCGAVVGLLRRLTRLPEQVPGLFEDLQTEHVRTTKG